MDTVVVTVMDTVMDTATVMVTDMVMLIEHELIQHMVHFPLVFNLVHRNTCKAVIKYLFILDGAVNNL